MNIRVYYEDTDCGGVVYHANYLRYMERARTEFLRERGIHLDTYHHKNIVFAVTELQIKYRFPARYNDLLRVETDLTELTTYRTGFKNRIYTHEDTLCCSAHLKLVAVNSATMKVTRVDDHYYDTLHPYLTPSN
ncbi:YbgC/FadM family acyl-CoA thioesterase [Chitinivibrio alkaliphilus]|uniref:Tol-pal system-associated acyl-CoA thioesterase n=1 Tax=Chitinivibrio alkaliphilus ACht1 TaxID=1313304 RepID=U7D839_9BACT|nr:YbgC/FadM family acyl-CoA thioesterase [Chitinivibrio alkaliphilus]ERP39120.1 tol-pal system-associated acyl-CoA thioesterase [Chitinivibrio alkaliphilus ACht1]